MLLSVWVELVHGVAFGAVSVFAAAYWWFANSDMQDDFVVALRALPDVVSL